MNVSKDILNLQANGLCRAIYVPPASLHICTATIDVEPLFYFGLTCASSIIFFNKPIAPYIRAMR